MKIKILLILTIFFKTSLAQVFVQSIHNSREISITVSCRSDSATVFVGCFKYVKYLCYGSVVSINVDDVKKEKGDSLIELHFNPVEATLSNYSNQLFTLQKGDDLKIRLIRVKRLRIPKNKNLKICLTIDNKEKVVYSQRYKGKFCHKRSRYSSHYKSLEGEIMPAR